MSVASLINANSIRIPLKSGIAQCCMTSPPYFGLRVYETSGNKAHELGDEQTPEEYVANMVAVFREVGRVLRDDGVLFLNIGDSYNGSGGAGGDYNPGGLREGQPRYPRRNIRSLKPKDLIGIPWMLAFALRADGWYLRSEVIWHKPNTMPESVKDRPTKSHEQLFLLSKSQYYFYDADATREPYSGETQPRLKRGVGDNHKNASDAPGQSQQRKSEKNIKGNMSERGVTRTTEGLSMKTSAEKMHPLGRNKRSVWTIPTVAYKGAHFATFPPALVEPCIKAGSSERGCCPKCGSPWRRNVEVTPGSAKMTPKTVAAHHARGGSGIPSGSVGKAGSSRVNPTRRTVGFSPSCECYFADPSMGSSTVPCIIFDPFVGSGTTLAVAQQLGRFGVGIDLSYSYLMLARERLGIREWNEWKDGVDGGDNIGDLPLFHAQESQLCPDRDRQDHYKVNCYACEQEDWDDEQENDLDT